jgi:hypothetical protein
MKRSALLLGSTVIAAATGGPALAAAPNVEASMVVTGTITVNPDGSVRDYTLYRESDLPPGVLQLVKQSVPHWTFQPVEVDGKPVEARTGMTLRIKADMTADHSVALAVSGANFGCLGKAAGISDQVCPPGSTVVRSPHNEPPSYPIGALLAGVSGEVYVAVEIGRDGKVVRAAAVRVNMYSFDSNKGGQAANRKVLADAAVNAIKDWKYAIPTVGAEAVQDHWIVTQPVNFILAGDRTHGLPTYGRWNSHVPGPEEDVPWAHDQQSTGGSDAIADNGQPFTRDPRFVLETRLGSPSG